MAFFLLGSGADPTTRAARRASRFRRKSATLSSAITLRPGRRVEVLTEAVLDAAQKIHASMVGGMVRVFEDKAELKPEAFMARVRELRQGEPEEAAETTISPGLEAELAGLEAAARLAVERVLSGKTDHYREELEGGATWHRERGLNAIADAFAAEAARRPSVPDKKAEEAELEKAAALAREEPPAASGEPTNTAETLPAPAETENPAAPEVPSDLTSSEPNEMAEAGPDAHEVDAVLVDPAELKAATETTLTPIDEPTPVVAVNKIDLLPPDWKSRTKDELVKLAETLEIPKPERVTKANMVMAIETWLG